MTKPKKKKNDGKKAKLGGFVVCERDCKSAEVDTEPLDPLLPRGPINQYSSLSVLMEEEGSPPTPAHADLRIPGVQPVRYGALLATAV